MENNKKYKFHVHGMHCNSCVLLTESEIGDLPNVLKVKSNLSDNTIEVEGNFGGKTDEQIAEELTKPLKDHGYTVSVEKQVKETKWSDFKIALPIALVFIFGFVFLQKIGVVNFIDIKGVSFSTAFLIGIIASLSSCMAVVVNDKNEICCHHFDKIEVGGTLFEDIHILMRETIEPNESIEQCLERGLKEEFGMKAELVSYLGSITSLLDLKDLARVEKTTLYFLCKPINFDYEKRKKDDPESSSSIKWIKADELIQLMKKQAVKYQRDDADESKIIMRIKF